MVTVQKANVVLDIPEYTVQDYLDMGYDVIDRDGHIIQKSIPKDLGALQKAYVEHIEKIKSLENEIKEKDEMISNFKKSRTKN